MYFTYEGGIGVSSLMKVINPLTQKGNFQVIRRTKALGKIIPSPNLKLGPVEVAYSFPSPKPQRQGSRLNSVSFLRSLRDADQKISENRFS